MLFVLGALDIYIENYSYESVFSFLRLGFGNLTDYEIDVLENYVLAQNVKKNAWLNGEKWEHTLKIHKNKKPSSEKFIADVNSAARKIYRNDKTVPRQHKGKKKGRNSCPRALLIS